MSCLKSVTTQFWSEVIDKKIAGLMKILFLAHRTPDPPNKGEKIRAYHVLVELVEETFRINDLLGR
jgi:hypothetical protein